jgi:hypothetical protein
MTKILHRDPDRRCKPLAEWPAIDRTLWQAALVPGDLLEDGGSRARRAEYSNRNAIYGYGRWLTWLGRQGLLEVESSPADRIIPARVAAYIADLEEHNATQTLLDRLQELAAVAVVMDSRRDWSWIYRMYSQIRSRHRPARSKRHRLVPIQELFDLGLALMTEAEQVHTACARALAYRDGLIIALLAARPLRLPIIAREARRSNRAAEWWEPLGLGRRQVFRLLKTLRDRLVKELRLAGAATLTQGNALLPAFMADYNACFAKPPANKKDLHRPLRTDDDLEDAFAWKEERTLSQALTLQYDKVIFILEPTEQAKAAIGKRVTVIDYPDGRLSIRYKGVELAYRTFDKVRQVDQGAIADNKRLGPILAMIRDEQLRLAGPNVAVDRAGATSMFAFSRSAEFLYELSEPRLAR